MLSVLRGDVVGKGTAELCVLVGCNGQRNSHFVLVGSSGQRNSQPVVGCGFFNVILEP